MYLYFLNFRKILDMPRSKRIADIDKDRLYKCYMNGRDYYNLAKDLGIKSQTAYYIIRTMFNRKGVASLYYNNSNDFKFDFCI